jgi:hypothetical protein
MLSRTDAGGQFGEGRSDHAVGERAIYKAKSSI